METLPTYVKILTYLFVIVYMLSVTLETTRGQIMATFTDRRQMGRALLANLVLVPLLGVILARLFARSPDVRTGFLLLALSPSEGSLNDTRRILLQNMYTAIFRQ